MTPARTAFLRLVASNAAAHGKQWSGPAAEVLMQAADAIRELATEADELAALRIEHAAWGAIIDATRADRDAARAEVAALRAQVAELTAGIDAVIDRKMLTDNAPGILLTLQHHYEMVCETAGKANDTVEDIGKVLKIDALASDDIVADVRARVAELTRHAASIHKAADAARKAERADVVAHLRTGGRVACDYADAIEAGEHEGAAGGS